MGNANVRQINVQAISQDPRPYLQNDLPKFIYQERIGNGKFMKSYLMKIDDTSVAVKVYFKPQDEDLETYAATLTWMWNALSPSQHPSLLPYQMWIKSSAKISKPNSIPIFLIRQYFPYNLYDRISTRPFLSNLEKLWIIYQLMRAVEEAHEEGVVHGDIKPENIMVTSWNWVILTDFAPYKPVQIPDDDPTDFHYFFDSMSRRRCYVAPERFFKSSGKIRSPDSTSSTNTNNTNTNTPTSSSTSIPIPINGSNSISTENNNTPDSSTNYLIPSMDVFSLGCTIAEILLDGEPLLDLPSMLKYKSCCEDSSNNSISSSLGTSKDTQNNLMTSLGDLDSPAYTTLNRIQNPLIRETITLMTQHSPSRRMPVKTYRLNLENEGVFPNYFGTTLYELFLRIHWRGATPDDRIGIICQNYSDIMENLATCIDVEGNIFFTNAMQKFAPHQNNATDDPIYSDKTVDIHSARLRKNENDEIDEKPLKSTKINLPYDHSNYYQNKLQNNEKNDYHNSKNNINYNNNHNKDINELISQFEKLLEEFKNSDTSPSLSSSPSHISLNEKQEKITKENIEKSSINQSSTLSTYSALVFESRGLGSKLFEVDQDELNNHSSSSSSSSSSSLNYSKVSEEIHEENFSRLGRFNKASGLLLIIQIICSTIRHLRCPQSKVISLMLLTRFGILLSDNIILERVVPFVMLCIEDPIAIVRATSIRCLRALLDAVTEVSQIDSNIFKEFLFPTLNNVISKDNEAVVRIAFAESLGRFAETSMRFLDVSRFNIQNKTIIGSTTTISNNNNGNSSGNSNGNNNNNNNDISINNSQNTPIFVEGSYDQQVNILHDQVSKWIRDLVLDGNILNNNSNTNGNNGNNNMSNNNSNNNERNEGRLRTMVNSHSSIIKRAILEDIVRLCVFFGKQERIMDLFAQLLAYVNHPDWELDWELRNAFCIKIPLVCSFLGSSVTSECILPFLDKARVDNHDMVIASAVKCVWTLIEMSLLSKPMICDTCIKTVPLLVHPVTVIRDNTIGMIAAAAKFFGITDSYVYLLPYIRPILVCDLIGLEITKKSLNQFLLSPLPRVVYIKVIRQWPQSIESIKKELLIYENNNNNSVNNGIDEEKRSSSKKTLSSSLGIPEINFDEDLLKKLKFIEPYLEAALKENPSRSTVLKGTNTSKRLSSARRQSVRNSTVQMNMDSLLDLFSYQTLTSFPDNVIQSLLVPHQKFSLNCSIQDDLKESNIISSPFPDMTLLRNIYGVLVNQVGSTRALEEGENNVTPFLGNAESASGLYSAQTQNNNSNTNNQTPQLRRGTSSVMAYGGTISLESIGDSDSSISEVHRLLRKIKALHIPPLSPDFGSLTQPTDGRAYSLFIEPVDNTYSGDSTTNQVWKPKENVVVSTMFEHTNAVNRLSVSHDQSFFVSASSDGTAKIWQTKGVERNAFPRSSLTYSKQGGKILDAIVVENSHSVATSSDNGTIHVWRVELGNGNNNGNNNNNNSGNNNNNNGNSNGNYSGNINNGSNNINGNNINNNINNRNRNSQQIPSIPPTDMINQQISGRYANTVSVLGSTVIKTINHNEGPITSLQHFNSDVGSLLTYVTQRGIIHSWDLRSSEEPFQYNIRPELGYPTTLVCSPDRNWMCVGTSRGFIGLWDIRYNVMCKLWRHSSGSTIHRLACTKASGTNSLREGALGSSEGAYLFVAAGKNEAAVWGIPEGGECLKCFRSVPMTAARGAMPNLPYLYDITIPSHSLSPFQSQYVGINRFKQPSIDEPAVRAIMGRITQSSSSYVVTAGTDKNIRYWDLSVPNKCFTISGLEPAQPKPVYETPPSPGLRGKLFLCYDSVVPSVQATLQSQLPVREYRGIVPPVSGFKDAILDLKTIDLPIKMMISASRDGEIKLWR